MDQKEYGIWFWPVDLQMAYKQNLSGESSEE